MGLRTPARGGTIGAPDAPLPWRSRPAMPTTDADRSLVQALVARQPLPQPRCVPLWHAAVDIGEREPLGRSPLGERWIVPILGGHFWGAPGHEALCGVVRPGGADRQLQLAEGHRRLHALYELQVDDGTVLTVLNQVTIDETRSGERYAIGHLEVTAPAGPHEWLNHRKIVGTLQVLRPERSAVLIRTFVVEG